MTTAEFSRLSSLTATHTAFANFSRLLSQPGYVPSLKCETARAGKIEGRKLSAHQHRAELLELADGYDSAMAELGDARRAFRS